MGIKTFPLKNIEDYKVGHVLATGLSLCPINRRDKLLSNIEAQRKEIEELNKQINQQEEE